MSDAERYGASLDDQYEEQLGAPRRPRCMAGKRICKVSIYAGPSGKRVRHGMDCPDRPGEPINVREEYRNTGVTLPRGNLR